MKTKFYMVSNERGSEFFRCAVYIQMNGELIPFTADLIRQNSNPYKAKEIEKTIEELCFYENTFCRKSCGNDDANFHFHTHDAFLNIARGIVKLLYDDKSFYSSKFRNPEGFEFYRLDEIRPSIILEVGK